MSAKNFQSWQTDLSRRRFLQTLGMAGMAGLAAPALVGLVEQAKAQPALQDPTSGIQQIVISCQENHSFDHYYGRYSGIGDYGIPPRWKDHIHPYHFKTLDPPDPSHNWNVTHTEWDGGKMDGFYKANGKKALGYYLQQDLPHYYSLLSQFTLCVNYFCGVLSETSPNRLVLYAGTCGGSTSNQIGHGQLNYPCIADLLQQHDISFKNYNCHCPNDYSKIALFQKWTGNRELNHTQAQFFSDCKNGTLPQVSFITTASPYDEHPSSNIQMGMKLQMQMINAVMNSPLWNNTVFLLTYDEGGGFFDHVTPPVIDAYGPGIRVPMLVISPLAKQGYLDPTTYDHGSVLKLIERVFHLPTLASINHRFDKHTPGNPPGGNEAADGKKYGPPAPPRDGSNATGDLSNAFIAAPDPAFNRSPLSYSLGL